MIENLVCGAAWHGGFVIALVWDIFMRCYFHKK
jgi:hypothetical protein